MPTKTENAEIARQIMPVPEVLEGIHQPPEGIFVLAWTPEDCEPLFQGSRWCKMLTIDEADVIRLYVSYSRETRSSETSDEDSAGVSVWHEAPTCVAEIAGYLRCIGGIGYPLEEEEVKS